MKIPLLRKCSSVLACLCRSSDCLLSRLHLHTSLYMTEKNVVMPEWEKQVWIMKLRKADFRLSHWLSPAVAFPTGLFAHSIVTTNRLHFFNRAAESWSVCSDKTFHRVAPIDCAVPFESSRTSRTFNGHCFSGCALKRKPRCGLSSLVCRDRAQASFGHLLRKSVSSLTWLEADQIAERLSWRQAAAGGRLVFPVLDAKLLL